MPRLTPHTHTHTQFSQYEILGLIYLYTRSPLPKFSRYECTRTLTFSQYECIVARILGLIYLYTRSLLLGHILTI
jgi:hypothetical protein